ncbi:uncharacterized protein LOC143605790 [Bidens hawaiensis]|uniref:uncharacterized protein LOC143605790 n=1 Tax=Bidens hawaiensis TaxID=980011 RepID=UPI004048F1F6
MRVFECVFLGLLIFMSRALILFSIFRDGPEQLPVSTMANDGDLNLKLEDDMSFTEVCVHIRNRAARSTKSFVRVLASDIEIILADLVAGILEVTIAVLYAIEGLAKMMMFLVMSMMEKRCNMVKMEVIEIKKPAEIELAEEEAAAALKAKADQKAAESKAKVDEEMKAYYEKMKSEMYAKIQILQAEIDELKREKKD